MLLITVRNILLLPGIFLITQMKKDFVILKEILKKFNLFRSDKSSIVIGNHDIFGGPQTAQDVFGFPTKCMNTNYHEKVAKFIDHFKELLRIQFDLMMNYFSHL